MTTRTPEDRIATREAALLRYAEGYPLPETSVNEIRTGLETFNGIESPLKDGAL